MIGYKTSEDNKYYHFRVWGHDTDVLQTDVPKEFHAVCGMVSVLTQSALYGCTKYCKNVKVTSYGSGDLDFYFPKFEQVGRAICDSALVGIQQVNDQFPQCFERGNK